MEEVEHTIDILEGAKEALSDEDASQLNDLSNQTTHSSCKWQDSADIDLAVIVYSLGKIVERKNELNLKNWADFKKSLDSLLKQSIIQVTEKDFDDYKKSLDKIKTTFTSISIDLKSYMKEIMRKASVNKACSIYEHGISMETTSKLLGVTQWELSEYSGQKSKIADIKQNKTIDIRERAKMAMEFFK